MYLFDLQAKLKRISPELVVLTDKPVLQVGGNPSFPLVLKFGKREVFHRYGKTLMDADTQKYIEMKENGQAGQFIGGVTRWVPELDVIDPESGKILAYGWRTIALLLVKKGVTNIQKVRRVFSPSVGEWDYDRATYEQKLAMIRKEA